MPSYPCHIFIVIFLKTMQQLDRCDMSTEEIFEPPISDEWLINIFSGKYIDNGVVILMQCFDGKQVIFPSTETCAKTCYSKIKTMTWIHQPIIKWLKALVIVMNRKHKHLSNIGNTYSSNHLFLIYLPSPLPCHTIYYWYLTILINTKDWKIYFSLA